MRKPTPGRPIRDLRPPAPPLAFQPPVPLRVYEDVRHDLAEARTQIADLANRLDSSEKQNRLLQGELSTLKLLREAARLRRGKKKPR